MRVPMLAALVVVASSPMVTAQVVAEMTPALIERAIQEGKAARGGPSAMSKSGPGLRHLGSACYVSSPYGRVVLAAREASAQYQPFTAADVTPEMIAPEVAVHCYPRDRPHTKQGVRAVAMTVAGSREVVPPIRSGASDQDLPADIAFRWGKVYAVYPVAAFTPAHELHVVYAGGDDVRLSLDGLKDLR